MNAETPKEIEPTRTAELYAINGFRYADYLKLSQWQRYRSCRIQWKKKKLEAVYIVLHIWPLSRWRFKIDTSQECDHFCMGPIEVQIYV